MHNCITKITGERDKRSYQFWEGPLQRGEMFSNLQFEGSDCVIIFERGSGNPQPVNGSPSSSSDFLKGPSVANECQTKQFIAPFVHNVDNYVWTLAGDNNGFCDWEIVSGQGGRIVSIRFGKGFGILTCRPENSCGTGTLFYKNYA